MKKVMKDGTKKKQREQSNPCKEDTDDQTNDSDDEDKGHWESYY